MAPIYFPNAYAPDGLRRRRAGLRRALLRGACAGGLRVLSYGGAGAVRGGARALRGAGLPAAAHGGPPSATRRRRSPRPRSGAPDARARHTATCIQGSACASGERAGSKRRPRRRRPSGPITGGRGAARSSGAPRRCARRRTARPAAPRRCAWASHLGRGFAMRASEGLPAPTPSIRSCGCACVLVWLRMRARLRAPQPAFSGFNGNAIFRMCRCE